MRLEPLVGAGGYTPARRLIGTLDDGSTVFVKEAVDESTRRWLAMERQAYEHLGPRPWLPRHLGSVGEDRLVMEDLRGARWPPPWTPGDVDRVLALLDEFASTPAPASAFRLTDTRGGVRRWAVIAADPAPIVDLGVCTAAWLEEALPTLMAADDAAVLDGDGILHMDVRSDNLCFDGDRLVLVDWTLMCRGAPGVDAAFFLPSVTLETGEPTRAVEPPLAAVVAGCLADWARQPSWPRVVAWRRAMFGVALPWAARLLGIRPPDRAS